MLLMLFDRTEHKKRKDRREKEKEKAEKRTTK